jgi:hypothetical protein
MNNTTSHEITGLTKTDALILELIDQADDLDTIFTRMIFTGESYLNARAGLLAMGMLKTL